MPRKYIRKSDRAVLSDDLFKTAQQLVKNGCSTRFAAKVVGASVSGLRKRLRVGVAAASLGRHQTFSREQENDFVEYCKKVKGETVTRNELRLIAFEYATSHNIKNQFVQSSGKAGHDWIRGFLKRHPEIVTKTASSTGFERVEHLLDLSHYQPLQPLRRPSSEATEAQMDEDQDGDTQSDEILCLVSDDSLPLQDPIKVETDCQQGLAEFQADEELEFGARAEAVQASSPPVYTQRVAASAPPPLPQSANPMFWPEEPHPKIRPGPGADECQIFGDFVASELRTLRSDASRKRLKRIIQKAILNIGEEEDVNIISG